MAPNQGFYEEHHYAVQVRMYFVPLIIPYYIRRFLFVVRGERVQP